MVEKEKKEFEIVTDKMNFFEKMLLVLKNAWQNMRNKNVPSKLKLVYVFYLLTEISYIISPIDIFPDWILPLIGFVDDLAMMPLIMHTLSRFNIKSKECLQLPSHNPPEKEAHE